MHQYNLFFFKLSQNVYLFHYIHRNYCFSFLKFEGYITFLWRKKNTLRLRVKCIDTTNTFSYCFSIINFEGHITFLWKKKIFEAEGWRQPSHPIKYSQSYLSCCMSCNEIDERYRSFETTKQTKKSLKNLG